MGAVWRIRLLTMGCVVATALAIGLISFFGFRRVVRDQQEQNVASHAMLQAGANDRCRR